MSPSKEAVAAVKPLEWHDDPRGGRQALAAGLGLYRVYRNNWYLNQDHMGEGDTASAQADFDRRIVGAIIQPEPAAAQADADLVAVDVIDTLIESLSEGLMTDAGLSKVDRDAMRHQVVALDMAREEIAEALRSKQAPAAVVPAGAYLVWSNEHRCWWGPNHSGYCSKLEDAGRYSREEALKICVGARGGRRFNDNPSEVPILYEDAVQFWPNDKEEWQRERFQYQADQEGFE